MIFGKNAGLMLKYQKAKAKMVEYDVSKQEYPHFPLNSNELSYPTTYVLSRYSECIMLKIVTKYGVDPNTLFGIESREKHENKNLSVLEDKLQMLKPNDREYAMSTCLIFIEGLEARKEVV